MLFLWRNQGDQSIFFLFSNLKWILISQEACWKTCVLSGWPTLEPSVLCRYSFLCRTMHYIYHLWWVGTQQIGANTSVCAEDEVEVTGCPGKGIISKGTASHLEPAGKNGQNYLGHLDLESMSIRGSCSKSRLRAPARKITCQSTVMIFLRRTSVQEIICLILCLRHCDSCIRCSKEDVIKLTENCQLLPHKCWDIKVYITTPAWNYIFI